MLKGNRKLFLVLPFLELRRKNKICFLILHLRFQIGSVVEEKSFLREERRQLEEEEKEEKENALSLEEEG